MSMFSKILLINITSGGRHLLETLNKKNLI